MYFIMHEEIPVASFSVGESENIYNIKINKDAAEHLPFGVTDRQGIARWVRDRSIPITRDGINRTMNKLKTTRMQLMLMNYGMSLTDHYWVLPGESRGKVTWSNSNCYSNKFRSSMSIDIADDITADIRGKTEFTPSASLQGDLKKKWIIDSQGDRWLVKGNYNNTGRQSIAEVIASKIHEEQGWNNFTQYRLVKISHSGAEVLGCMCRNFTDDKTEFISADAILRNANKPNDMSWFDYYIKVCEEHGIENAREFMEYEALVDFIISNVDRHTNNFGILRDTKTLKWLRCAPIFDSGNALFYGMPYIPVDRGLLRIRVNSLATYEAGILKRVTDRSRVDIDRLPSSKQVQEILNKDIFANSEINSRIARAYSRKIKYLDEMQRGINIWKA